MATNTNTTTAEVASVKRTAPVKPAAVKPVVKPALESAPAPSETKSPKIPQATKSGEHKAVLDGQLTPASISYANWLKRATGSERFDAHQVQAIIALHRTWQGSKERKDELEAQAEARAAADQAKSSKRQSTVKAALETASIEELQAMLAAKLAK